ncbi:hypothetical protein HYV50_01805 [Candidatus Pacearchaeota archaeon]|nr:hypothetical protein [Candidatus Pacearchaeota archaeon]
MRKKTIYAGLAGAVFGLAGHSLIAKKDNSIRSGDRTNISAETEHEEAYIEELPRASLEEILKNSHAISPPNENRLRNSDILVVYNTNVDGSWCPNCLALKKTKYWENITSDFADKNVGFLLLDSPSPAPEGKLRDIVSSLQIKGPPSILIFNNKDGNLGYLANVNYTNPADTLGDTRKSINLALNGEISQPEPIKIDKEGFKNYRMGFSPSFDDNNKEPHFDKIAVLTALARFGFQNRYSYDPNKDEIMIKLNLENPDEFLFARIFDRDPNTPRNSNRWVLNQISNSIYDRAIEKRKINRSFAEAGDKINATLEELGKEDPVVMNTEEQLRRKERHREFHAKFFHFTDPFLPHYIKDNFEKFVSEMQSRALGTAESYSWIEEFTSSEARDKIIVWAEKNGKKYDIRRLPTGREIRDFGSGLKLSNKGIESLIDSLNMLKREYRALEDHNLCFADITAPLPPIQKLIDETDTAVIFRERRRDNIPGKTALLGSQPNVPNPYDVSDIYFLNVLRFQHDNNLKFFYLPLINAGFGFVHPPFIGGPATLTDYLADPSYGDGIFVFKRGKAISRMFSYDVNHEALTNVLTR